MAAFYLTHTYKHGVLQHTRPALGSNGSLHATWFIVCHSHYNPVSMVVSALTRSRILPTSRDQSPWQSLWSLLCVPYTCTCTEILNSFVPFVPWIYLCQLHVHVQYWDRVTLFIREDTHLPLHNTYRFGLPSWAVLVAQSVKRLSSTQNIAGLDPRLLFLLGRREVVFRHSCFALLCLNDWSFMYMCVYIQDSEANMSFALFIRYMV